MSTNKDTKLMSIESIENKVDADHSKKTDDGCTGGLDGISGKCVSMEKQITVKSVTHVCSKLLYLTANPPT